VSLSWEQGEPSPTGKNGQVLYDRTTERRR